MSRDEADPAATKGSPAMGRINWLRVLLCGLVTGGVWTLLSVVLLAVAGEEFMAALRRIGPDHSSGGVPLTLIANLAAGIWAMWLYAAIRPRYGPGVKTAVIAGFAWWFLQSLQSAKWVTLVGALSNLNLYPIAAATLVAMILAVVVGAWMYQD